mgnify:CR=1 FL=1
MNEVDILKGALDAYTEATGIKAILEPLGIARQEPTFYVSITGFEEQGENRETVTALGQLMAYGSGPSFFLSQVAAASRATAKLTYGKLPVTLNEKVMAGVTFKKRGPGGFRKVEEEDPKFPFLWLEEYDLEVSYNIKVFDEE